MSWSGNDRRRERSVYDKPLRIYLNDHLAGATAGVELSRRVARAHRSSARASEMRRLAEDIDQDRQSLIELMNSLEIAPHRYRMYGGWIAEKVARLKPNGRVYRRSGLSTLVELEVLRLGIEGKHQMWQALVPVAAELDQLETSVLQGLMDRASAQMTTVDSLHHAAAASVLTHRSG
ncbi:hypothetical protein FBY35_4067 [Streptomyces sp. SLBN-118]|uniref:hypothetical protein n=1 Tax=Streptomyces sp. SLBN-118 TaxID=2768454 RepID=UPI00116B02B1|nr:hypothetical protein [Streptomyces sp. SLBN-118]TQK42639.1 hypothetical protein FBY35_4067 [Streptomyces sp. SLBN-118]